MKAAQIALKKQAVEWKSDTANSTTKSNINTVDISALKTKFETDGFVILSSKNNGGASGAPPLFNFAASDEANTKSTVMFESIQQDIHDQFRSCFQTMHENQHVAFPAPLRRMYQNSNGKQQVEYSMKKGVKHGFREIVMRNEGRFELSLSPAQFGRSHPFLHSTLFDPCSSTDKSNTNGATQFPFLSQLLSAIFENDGNVNCSGDVGIPSYHLTNLSAVIATPGAKEQKWHADGGHLDLERHLPCHCLNVFVPLVDMSLELGPTEFRPGTHYHTRNLAPMILVAKARKTLRPPALPLLKKGDMLLFDYRVLHRGRQNSSLDQNRTMLVMTFSKPWFKDVLNYPRGSIIDERIIDGNENKEAHHRENAAK